MTKEEHVWVMIWVEVLNPNAGPLRAAVMGCLQVGLQGLGFRGLGFRGFCNMLTIINYTVIRLIAYVYL